MSDLARIITTLTHNPRPALTWYGTDRMELGGPVVARWLAKIANLLGSDLHADNLGTDRSHILLDLPPSWQHLLWATAASLMDWDMVEVDSDSALEAPVHVYASTPEASADPWTTVLLHDLSPMAFHWAGELPDGARDALAELMTQADALWVPSPDLGVVVPAQRRNTAIALTHNNAQNWIEVATQWAGGNHVVVIDTTVYDSEGTQRICTVENAEFLQP